MPRSYQSLLWSQLADEARSAATQIEDVELKLHVLLLAARYLVWAKLSERGHDAPNQHPDQGE
jgi:hypothetical protein